MDPTVDCTERKADKYRSYGTWYRAGFFSSLVLLVLSFTREKAEHPEQ
jgi:hypothetical protein